MCSSKVYCQNTTCVCINCPQQILKHSQVVGNSYSFCTTHAYDVVVRLNNEARMNFRITLLFFYCHLLRGIAASIASSRQCSTASSRSTCIRDSCPSSGGCLNVLWTEFKPYSYIKDSVFMGIIPGNLFFSVSCELFQVRLQSY